MGKICEFCLFVCSLVLIALSGMVAWSAYPQTIRDVTLTSQSGEQIHIKEAKYSRLFRTITYTVDGIEYTIDAEQYVMSQEK